MTLTTAETNTRSPNMNRKFGRRGGAGRGASHGGGKSTKHLRDLPEVEQYRAFVEYYELLCENENEKDSSGVDHRKSDFLNGVVSRLAKEFVQVSQNQTISKIIETIIASASRANLRTLFISAVTDLSVTFLDSFASHVLEALVLRLPEFFEQPSDEDDGNDVSQDTVAESFESMCEFVDSQFEVLVTHMYGSHVLRAFLEALSGVSVVHELKKSKRPGHDAYSQKDPPETLPKQKPPETFKAVFDRYSKKLFRVCDYEVHLKDPFFSRLLQAVLMILHKVDTDRCQKCCQTIVQKVTDSVSQSEDSMESIPDLARDPAGSHLLEVIFKLSGDDLMQQMFESLLQGKLLYYAVHHVANHVLQTFIAALRDGDLMEKVSDELSKCMEDVMALGYFGLIVSLAEGCRRLCVRQDEFIMTLMDAFHCKEPQEKRKSLMKLIASLTAYEVFYSLEEGRDQPAEVPEVTLKGPVSLHSSRLIQELLQFQKPTHAALGLLDFQPTELQMLCCDPAGSHVVDVFFSSPTVIKKNRDLFLRKLKGLLVDVACSRNGSRCLESVWKNLGLEQRTALAKELAQSERLGSDRFGHFLFRSFGLALFKTNRKKWQGQQEAPLKRKRALKELLSKTVSGPPVKKKKTEGDAEGGQKGVHSEDSITAMFIKQKKQLDTKRLLASPPRAKQAAAEDTNEHVLPLSAESAEEAESPQGKKKKKKRKVKSAETAQEPDSERVEMSVVGKIKKINKKCGKDKADFQEKVKKKKKAKKSESGGDE